MCESDGGCGTYDRADNCYVRSYGIFSVYRVVSNCPRLVPIKGDACDDEVCAEEDQCPVDPGALPDCDEPSLVVGGQCESDADECGTDRDHTTCSTSDGLYAVYRVVGTATSSPTTTRIEGCPVLSLVSDSVHCNSTEWLRKMTTCDTPGLQAGDLCEGDGECGTDNQADNCFEAFDLYRVVSTTRGPSTAPTPFESSRPTLPPSTGAPTTVAFRGCAADMSLVDTSLCPDEADLASLPACDDPDLKTGELCEATNRGECGTDNSADNCQTQRGYFDVYVLATDDKCPALAVAHSCPAVDEEIQLCTDKLEDNAHCLGNGWCGTDASLNNCPGNRSVYVTRGSGSCVGRFLARVDECPSTSLSELPTCDGEFLDVGDACEADGECHTGELNNCNGQFDVFELVDSRRCPTLQLACPDFYVHKSCDSLSLQLGDYCESRGECQASGVANNCNGQSVYRVVGIAPLSTPYPTATRPTLFESPDCPRLAPLENADDCPLNGRALPSCGGGDDVVKGDLCEGDGMCGTDDGLDNCMPGAYDVYRVVREVERTPSPTAQSDVRPTVAAREEGCPILSEASSCPESNPRNLPDCDDRSLRVGHKCEGSGECGTDVDLDNCEGLTDIYVVVAEAVRCPTFLDQAETCPANATSLRQCNNVTLVGGDYCLGGVCGASGTLNNCEEASVYVVRYVTPSASPTRAPTKSLVIDSRAVSYSIDEVNNETIITTTAQFEIETDGSVDALCFTEAPRGAVTKLRVVASDAKGDGWTASSIPGYYAFFEIADDGRQFAISNRSQLVLRGNQEVEVWRFESEKCYGYRFRSDGHPEEVSIQAFLDAEGQGTDNAEGDDQVDVSFLRFDWDEVQSRFKDNSDECSLESAPSTTRCVYNPSTGIITYDVEFYVTSSGSFVEGDCDDIPDEKSPSDDSGPTATPSPPPTSLPTVFDLCFYVEFLTGEDEETAATFEIIDQRGRVASSGSVDDNVQTSLVCVEDAAPPECYRFVLDDDLFSSHSLQWFILDGDREVHLEGVGLTVSRGGVEFWILGQGGVAGRPCSDDLSTPKTGAPTPQPTADNTPKPSEDPGNNCIDLTFNSPLGLYIGLDDRNKVTSNCPACRVNGRALPAEWEQMLAAAVDFLSNYYFEYSKDGRSDQQNWRFSFAYGGPNDQSPRSLEECRDLLCSNAANLGGEKKPRGDDVTDRTAASLVRCHDIFQNENCQDERCICWLFVDGSLDAVWDAAYDHIGASATTLDGTIFGDESPRDYLRDYLAEPGTVEFDFCTEHVVPVPIPDDDERDETPTSAPVTFPPTFPPTAMPTPAPTQLNATAADLPCTILDIAAVLQEANIAVYWYLITPDSAGDLDKSVLFETAFRTSDSEDAGVAFFRNDFPSETSGRPDFESASSDLNAVHYFTLLCQMFLGLEV
mmetsp:Transcript_10811/g.34553  ORF Transcript_10811/g.34553 Transcript_10811/m.34553 type:complete len:1413 (-) Transcript_10811:128-4366(-)